MKNNKASKQRTMFIFYSNFLNNAGEKHVIGGIQQYIFGLIEVFSKTFNIKVIQKGRVDFHKIFDTYEVYGFNVLGKKVGKELYHKMKPQIKQSDYIIWASDRISYKTNHHNSISIQHGITFDFIDYKHLKFGNLLKTSLLLSVLYRIFQQANAIRYFLRSKKVVCVDYNFLNWARTILPRDITDRTTVIPNYFKELNPTVNDFESIKIIFARRFVEARGVFILAEIIESITKQYPNVEFGIYGEGPHKGFLSSKFKDYPNVLISSYEANQASKILKAYNVAVIPTYGSEGTSFSLLESMASGCVPLASNIGGMTNIIIDGYNGFLINPEAMAFIEKIKFLIENPEILKSLQRNALISVEQGFGFQVWKQKWEALVV
jgi:glycosyltransferase involved in cell wall biosynthesis